MPKGPTLLREINEKRILSFLRANRVSSRQEMAERLGLSKNTVSLIVEKFLEDGLVQEVGADPQGIGRPRTQLCLAADAFRVLGILVRDTSCEAVLTDYHGAMLKSARVNVHSRDPQACLACIEDLVHRLAGPGINILGLGVSIPGLVDPDAGLVRYSTHLGWRDVPVAEPLAQRLGVSVQVLNRVKAAALAPVHVIPEDAHSTFYIRIDEGVGGAFVLGNEIVHGFSRTAGEIGHVVVAPDGPRCTCGQRGCLEQMVSVPAVLDRLGVRKIDPADDDTVRSFFADRQHAPTSDPFHDVLARVGTHLGTAIALVINLLNPEYIVIDAPYNDVGTFQQAVRDAVRDRALQIPASHTQLLFLRTAHASAWGAALAVIHNFEATPSL
ncbi:ROK family transcriptional regulator [Alicyclobacillus sp.]|uniref:ROK family transcriptional regulator n=1 Tax=Alicyclobacillus sp. TaxID=61169 RepID=UPI0025B84DB8|nr:ROK family transcriptional regulator [Alicyclobacillus sp.]MCL6516650.1 ROK family transcriptional regulator [Alicyclobacillus sp.]